MNSSPSLLIDNLHVNRPRSPKGAQLFYTGASALLLILMLFGFQQFYLHGQAFPNRELAPPIRTLLILHGTAMTAWMLLFLVQPLLVVSANSQVHMMLGRIGAVLAASIFFLGLKLGIEAAKVSPPEVRLWNMPYKQFLTVPIISITIFAGFVTAGILSRRRPEIHRAMMLLATLSAMTAALDRIDAISLLYRQSVWGTIFGPFFSSLVIGLVFLVVNWALTRKFDRYYAMGWIGLVAASAGIMKLSTTEAWDSIASFLLCCLPL